jgi:ABC-type sugar transport system permease subunit
VRSWKVDASFLALPAAAFLIVWFLIPLVRFFVLAFEGAGGPLGTFQALVQSEVYLRVPGHGYETGRCAGYAAKLNSVAASDARAFCSALI